MAQVKPQSAHEGGGTTGAERIPSSHPMAHCNSSPQAHGCQCVFQLPVPAEVAVCMKQRGTPLAYF